MNGRRPKRTNQALYIDDNDEDILFSDESDSTFKLEKKIKPPPKPKGNQKGKLQDEIKSPFDLLLSEDDHENIFTTKKEKKQKKRLSLSSSDDEVLIEPTTFGKNIKNVKNTSILNQISFLPLSNSLRNPPLTRTTQFSIIPTKNQTNPQQSLIDQSIRKKMKPFEQEDDNFSQNNSQKRLNQNVQNQQLVEMTKIVTLGRDINTMLRTPPGTHRSRPKVTDHNVFDKNQFIDSIINDDDDYEDDFEASKLQKKITKHNTNLFGVDDGKKHHISLPIQPIIKSTSLEFTSTPQAHKLETMSNDMDDVFPGFTSEILPEIRYQEKRYQDNFEIQKLNKVIENPFSIGRVNNLIQNNSNSLTISNLNSDLVVNTTKNSDNTLSTFSPSIQSNKKELQSAVGNLKNTNTQMDQQNGDTKPTIGTGSARTISMKGNLAELRSQQLHKHQLVPENYGNNVNYANMNNQIQEKKINDNSNEQNINNITINPKIDHPFHNNNNNNPIYSTQQLLQQYRFRNRDLVLENTNIMSQLKLARRMGDTLRMSNNTQLIYVKSVNNENENLILKNKKLNQNAQNLTLENDGLRVKLLKYEARIAELEGISAEKTALDVNSSLIKVNNDDSGDRGGHILGQIDPYKVLIDPIIHQDTINQLNQAEFSLLNLTIRFEALEEAHESLKGELKVAKMGNSIQLEEKVKLLERVDSLQEMAISATRIHQEEMKKIQNSIEGLNFEMEKKEQEDKQNGKEFSATKIKLDAYISSLELELSQSKSQIKSLQDGIKIDQSLLKQHQIEIERMHTANDEASNKLNRIKTRCVDIISLYQDLSKQYSDAVEAMEQYSDDNFMNEVDCANGSNVGQSQVITRTGSENQSNQAKATESQPRLSIPDDLNTTQLLTTLETTVKNTFSTHNLSIEQFQHNLAQFQNNAQKFQNEAQNLKHDCENALEKLHTETSSRDKFITELENTISTQQLRIKEMGDELSKFNSANNEALTLTQKRLSLSEEQVKDRNHHIEILNDKITHIRTEYEARVKGLEMEREKLGITIDGLIQKKQIKDGLLQTATETINEWIAYSDDLKYELGIKINEIQKIEEFFDERETEFRRLLQQCSELLQVYATNWLGDNGDHDEVQAERSTDSRGEKDQNSSGPHFSNVVFATPQTSNGYTNLERYDVIDICSDSDDDNYGGNSANNGMNDIIDVEHEEDDDDDDDDEYSYISGKRSNNSTRVDSGKEWQIHQGQNGKKNLENKEEKNIKHKIIFNSKIRTHQQKKKLKVLSKIPFDYVQLSPYSGHTPIIDGRFRSSQNSFTNLNFDYSPQNYEAGKTASGNGKPHDFYAQLSPDTRNTSSIDGKFRASQGSFGKLNLNYSPRTYQTVKTFRK
jgi:hypothetical protein